MKLNPYLTSYTKVNSEWIRDLNIRAKTIKLLEENMGGKLHDFRFGNHFLDMTPKKENKFDYIKIQNCAKDTITVKRQPRGENI